MHPSPVPAAATNGRHDYTVGAIHESPDARVTIPAKAGWMAHGIDPTVGADAPAARTRVTKTTQAGWMAHGIDNHA